MLILDACNSVFGVDVPNALPYLVSLFIRIIQIAVPILLIIFGMLDLGKAVTGQKEDEIKKGQQTFFKRLIAAIMVFLVVVIVQLLIGVVANATEEDSVWGCVDYFINYEA